MKEQNKMKKLMIAAAIVCAAAISQAAQYNWQATGDTYIYSTDDAGGTYPSVAAGTIAYFAFVDAYSQADLVNDFANGSVNYSKFAEGANSAMNVSGGVGLSANFTADYTTDQQAYFVIFENGNMFVSGETTARYLAIGAKGVNFPDQTNISDWETFFGNAADGYSQAGWYKSVPEPTSGLLLLLGVAGLALRRRRA